MSYLCPILSDDLMNEILLRLPVEPLLRCKSVSKSWLSHISSPSFVISHLALATANQTYIIRHYAYSDSDTSVIDFASRETVAHFNFPFSEANQTPVDVSESDPPISVINANAATRKYFTDLNLPTYGNQRYSTGGSSIIGSACGIVCVQSKCANIYLWNPATKQSKLIPSPMLHDCGVYHPNLGFGFDEINNDFKVARFVMPFMHTEVYSSNTNAWRMVEDRPIDIPCFPYKFKVCVNGFLCSVGIQNDMVIFDLNKEVFTCAIKLPVATFGKADASFTHFKDCITYFHDSIAVILYSDNEDNSKINLWMLDDKTCLHGGGIEASWTLMLNIDLNLRVVFIQCYFNNGDLLLLNDDDDDDRCLYDPITKDFKDFSCSFCMLDVFKYTESLVSIPGSKPVN